MLGGTWSEYPPQYQEEFLRDAFYASNTFFDRFDADARNRAYKYGSDRAAVDTNTAANDIAPSRPKLSLAEEQRINETARVRIIGLTLETRPDSINEQEIVTLRRYGCTRVQLGVQHTDEEILRKINRGCKCPLPVHGTGTCNVCGLLLSKDLHTWMLDFFSCECDPVESS